MTVDVIVPTTRPSVSRLIDSLRLGRLEPDTIWVVTNEVEPIPGATFVGFNSVLQPFGSGDAGLRRNLGAELSTADIIVFLDDDLVAPADLLESAARIAQADGFCWGHHRYTDFDTRSMVKLMLLPPDIGRSRENGVNRWHGWQSSYAGNLAIKRDLFWSTGGFDLAYLGHHGSEDQQLGRRLSQGRNQTYVHEPPFAWHPIAEEYHSTPRTNVEAGPHALADLQFNGHAFLACETCLWRKPADVSALTLSDTVVIPYRREQFTLTQERI